MLRYLSKNKTIPQYFAKVRADRAAYQGKLDQLNTAISRGIFSPIDEDPEAPLLLLYAIEHELVPYWSGLTLLTYSSRWHSSPINKSCVQSTWRILK